MKYARLSGRSRTAAFEPDAEHRGIRYHRSSMDDPSDIDARRRARARRMTSTVVRPGETPPRERAVVGADSIALATALTTMAFSLAGVPPARIPHAEWPIVRRRLHEPE